MSVRPEDILLTICCSDRPRPLGLAISKMYISGSAVGSPPAIFHRAFHTRDIRFVPVRGARGDKDCFWLYRYRAYRYTLYGLRRRAHRSPAQSVPVSPRCASAQKVQLDRDVRFTLEFSLNSPARKPEHARGAGHTRTHVTCACACACLAAAMADGAIRKRIYLSRRGVHGQGGGKSTSDGYDSRCSYFRRWISGSVG